MLFEVVSWVVSVFNEQFWQYIYVYYVDEVGFSCLLFCFNEGNQAWVKNVGVLVFSFVQFNLSYNGCFNWYYMYDIGVVNISLLLQVVDLDIYGYMMGGFDYEKIVVEFDLNKDGLELVCFIVLGYLGDFEQFDEFLCSCEQGICSCKLLNVFIYKIIGL